MADSLIDTSLLDLPLGLPGSGRQRYAAAMAMYQAGEISAEVLEVFRISSPRDGDDPAVLLAERGLPDPRAAAAITRLVAEIAIYVGKLSGPGIAEVSAGIAANRQGKMQPDRMYGSHTDPVWVLYMDAALAALSRTHPTLASALRAAMPYLPWQSFDGYPADQIGQAFLDGNIFCTVVGETGPIFAQGFDLGLFLIAPHLLYRDHHHKAPELYAPLTGPHGWRFGPGQPLIVKPAHEPVWNEPNVPHLTKVGPLPFLSIFAWTDDVNDPAYVISASDWAELEALRLG